MNATHNTYVVCTYIRLATIRIMHNARKMKSTKPTNTHPVDKLSQLVLTLICVISKLL